MKKIYMASEVHPRDRLAHWYDVAGKFYVGHRCELNREARFNASIEAADLSGIDVSILDSNPVHFIRSASHVSAFGDLYTFICTVLSGRAIWLQDGREGEGTLGDLVLLDAYRPYELTFCEPTRFLILKVPQQMIEQRVGPTVGLTAVTISGSSALGGLASGFLRLLPERLPLDDHSAGLRIGAHAVDLTAMALLAVTAQRRAVLSSAKEVSLAALRSAIDINLADPELNGEAVAKSAGISVRYARLLLSEQGTTVEKSIVDRRLEQCRKLLDDPTQGHRSITEIALSWGFSDLSHFGRRFRLAYGVSPRDYRAETLERHTLNRKRARD